MNAILLKNGEEFPYIILGTSYSHPISDIYQFVGELRDNNYRGDILLDALLSNGFSENRYAKIFFDGSKFIETDLSVVFKVSTEINNKVYTYFYENPDIVRNNANLPNAQKYLLTKGKLIKKEKYL